METAQSLHSSSCFVIINRDIGLREQFCKNPTFWIKVIFFLFTKKSLPYLVLIAIRDVNEAFYSFHFHVWPMKAVVQY